MRTFAKVIAGVAAVFYLASGVWAFAAPESFFDNIATYPPYNEHLLRDIGAFLIGLGVVALAGLLSTDALTAVLAGVAAASLMHGVSHFMDHDLGRASDPWINGAFGVAALCGFLAAAASRRALRSTRAARPSPERAPHDLAR
jgi:hypothetical protein